MYRLIAFVLLSALLGFLSRASLRMPRSHGCYRFLAAQFLLALILFNLDRWFDSPFSAYQIVSWLLLAVSIVLVLSGALTLVAAGKPDSCRISEVPIAGLERTTELVTIGIYKYNRHPIYA